MPIQKCKHLKDWIRTRLFYPLIYLVIRHTVLANLQIELSIITASYSQVNHHENEQGPAAVTPSYPPLNMSLHLTELRQQQLQLE